MRSAGARRRAGPVGEPAVPITTTTAAASTDAKATSRGTRTNQRYGRSRNLGPSGGFGVGGPSIRGGARVRGGGPTPVTGQPAVSRIGVDNGGTAAPLDASASTRIPTPTAVPPSAGGGSARITAALAATGANPGGSLDLSASLDGLGIDGLGGGVGTGTIKSKTEDRSDRRDSITRWTDRYDPNDELADVSTSMGGRVPGATPPPDVSGMAEAEAATVIQRWYRSNIGTVRRNRVQVAAELSKMLKSERSRLTGLAASAAADRRRQQHEQEEELRRCRERRRPGGKRLRAKATNGSSTQHSKASSNSRSRSTTPDDAPAPASLPPPETALLPSETADVETKRRPLLTTGKLDRMKASARRRAGVPGRDQQNQSDHQPAADAVADNSQHPQPTATTWNEDAMIAGAASSQSSGARPGPGKDDGSNGSSGKGGRLASLLDFLDRVDSTHTDLERELHTTKSAVHSALPARQPALVTPTEAMAAPASRIRRPEAEREFLEDASAVTATVTSTILQQRLELEEKDRVIAELRRVREAAAAGASETAAVAREDANVSLGAQLEECNATINRHLQFIDRLIKDKKELGKRCEELVSQLKTADSRFKSKLDGLKEARKTDLRRQKEKLAATEKLRREKWIKEQTVRIKDMTVKGLEPEIKRLVAEHKAEVQRIRESKEGDFSEQAALLRKEQDRELEALEQRHVATQRAAITAEQERCRQHFLDQARMEEKGFQEERRRLQADLQHERDRKVEAIAEERKAIAAEAAAARDLETRANEALRKDTERLLQEAGRRHDQDLHRLKEQLKIEKESWEDMFLRRQEAQMKAKEGEIRELLRKERDSQIAMVIDRLEREAEENQSSNDEQFNVRLKRIQEKLNLQLVDAEQSEQACLAKYNDARQRLMQANEELASIRGTLSQRDQDLARAQETATRLTAERDRVSDIVRVEFAEALAVSESEITTLRSDFQQIRDKSRKDLADVQEAKDTELDSLHHRIQSAISKKDETIATLREQGEAASRRADHLEELLAAQREHIV